MVRRMKKEKARQQSHSRTSPEDLSMLTALRVTLVGQQVSAMKNVLRNLSLALKDHSCPPTDPMTSVSAVAFFQ